MRSIFLLLILFFLTPPALAADAPYSWRKAWPDTDFGRSAVHFKEISSGGVDKDAIAAILHPRFRELGDVDDIGPDEPVIGVVIGGEARAYPLRVLVWHEIVNDEVGGIPIAVTYCPLCNSAIVYDRRVDGRAYRFGVSGMLRNSDMVMYDHETQSWWQQYTGEAIVGTMTGAKLALIPARLLSFSAWKARHRQSRVLTPYNANARPYGDTPYAGYDRSARPFLYDGSMPRGIKPLARVIRVGDRAFALDHLRELGRIETADGLILTWTPGQNSVMDSRRIAKGRDVGNVVVRRRTGEGEEDVAYGVDFAFAFHAFYPEAEIVTGR